MKDKIIKIISLFLPTSKLRKKFRKSFIEEPQITKYELNRCLYNIGEHSYISGDTVIVNPKETQIGKYCSIARGCFIGTSQHPTNFLSTHCFIYSEYDANLYGELRTPKENIVDISKKIYPPIKIGNDVWIGLNAIIMDGLTICDGAIIGAGAVVTHDVPPYAIVGGVPAIKKIL